MLFLRYGFPIKKQLRAIGIELLYLCLDKVCLYLIPTLSNLLGGPDSECYIGMERNGSSSMKVAYMIQ
ncbi:hypothetical protein LC065_12890 [Halobacillus litoralis]|uniref:hypothetical protein n=1 Tax=Halobacillus litoralis TaxID=45668 RepID=UPI00273FAB59|nr:hypothetical protein [Halobacillus litoralis]WLR46467.1 hypothetical protein LC065_12890 [Halobacillus litoralis]